MFGVRVAESEESVRERALRDDEIRGILEDPVMRQVIICFYLLCLYLLILILFLLLMPRESIIAGAGRHERSQSSSHALAKSNRA